MRSRSMLLLVSLASSTLAAASPPEAERPKPISGAKLVKEKVAGGVSFPGSDSAWTRLTGKAQVLGPYLLQFDDGTQVDLRFAMDAPEMEQRGRSGGAPGRLAHLAAFRHGALGNHRPGE